MYFPMVFGLFVAVPIVEIFLLIKVGSSIGALATIAIVIATALIGTRMLRAQGLSTMNQAKSRLASGQIPAMEMMEGFALAFGGALLLTPGFVTDAVGFACLIPFTRRLLIKTLARNFRISAGGFANSPAGEPGQSGSKPAKPSDGGDVIEGEYRRK